MVVSAHPIHLLLYLRGSLWCRSNLHCITSSYRAPGREDLERNPVCHSWSLHSFRPVHRKEAEARKQSQEFFTLMYRFSRTSSNCLAMRNTNRSFNIYSATVHIERDLQRFSFTKAYSNKTKSRMRSTKSSLNDLLVNQEKNSHFGRLEKHSQ